MDEERNFLLNWLIESQPLLKDELDKEELGRMTSAELFSLAEERQKRLEEGAERTIPGSRPIEIVWEMQTSGDSWGRQGRAWLSEKQNFFRCAVRWNVGGELRRSG